MIDWNWWKKRLLNVEMIAFLIVVLVCLYLYFTYDRHKIKLYNDEIDIESLFATNPVPHALRPFNLPHRRGKKV